MTAQGDLVPPNLLADTLEDLCSKAGGLKWFWCFMPTNYQMSCCGSDGPDRAP